MLPEWQTGIVRRIESVNAATRSFFIELPSVQQFHFKAGQFVTLDLPIHEQRNRRWRSYSIASAPDDSNMIELIIVLVEGGAGTPYLFNEVQVGHELTLRGPHGVFVLPQELDDSFFLICTGTGMAPFRSMAAWLAAHPQSHGPIHLIFGCRNQSELLYRQELELHAKTMTNFHYHPTLSREKWGGREGYVHAIYEELCTDRPSAQFFLCGWKAMIDEAKQRILELGYEKKRIHLELYG